MNRMIVHLTTTNQKAYVSGIFAGSPFAKAPNDVSGCSRLCCDKSGALAARLPQPAYWCMTHR